MTTTEFYIREFDEDMQEQLFEEGHYSCAGDWPGQGEEMLSNMYSDPKNTHAQFPCVWLEIQVRPRTMGAIADHWRWDETFRVKDATVLFDIGKANLHEARKVFVDRYGLTAKQFLLLMIVQDEFAIDLDLHGSADVEWLEGRFSCDDKNGVRTDEEPVTDIVVDLLDVEVETYRMGERNPMFEDTTVGDLYELQSASAGSRYLNPDEKPLEEFVDDLKTICEVLHSYAQDYLAHIQTALRKEHERINSFEYWQDMAEANEWMVTIES